MYEIGNQEVQAIKKIISKGKLFRYLENSECEIFLVNVNEYFQKSGIIDTKNDYKS